MRSDENIVLNDFMDMLLYCNELHEWLTKLCECHLLKLDTF